ncbi:MAG TPA: glycosyltransferase family 39 protein [Gallionella sp.]|nr:glycosyltransferase family 39 protein [Gallionella sp.]
MPITKYAITEAMNPFRATTGTRGLARQWAATGTTVRNFPLLLVVTLVVAYILPGLIGHDPWKQDEAYIFGCIYHMVETGDWVVPTLAGEPFMEKPPLYYLVAAALARLASPILPLHDGARLASGLFVAVTLLSVGWAARRSWGEGYGRGAVLLMVSSLGLLIHAHMMLTDIALLAGFGVALAGFVACRRGIRGCGLLLGTGIGMAFLAKGLIGPGVIVITALLLPVLFREWRDQSYYFQLRWAAVAALPWLTIWPTALYLRSPELFHVWFWDNNIGRFFGFSVPTLGAATEPGFWWRTFPSFLFPIWLFVGLVFWKLRRSAWQQPAVQIGITLSLILGLVLVTSASARAIYAMPMVAMLALVGAGAMESIPARIERAFGYIGIIVGAGAMVLFWGVWKHLVEAGHAPEWPWLGRWLPLDFALPVSGSAVAAAAALSIGAVILVTAAWRHQARGLVIWCTALIVTWGLLTTLWLPWLDAAKSYRAMYQNMKLALPAQMNCVSSRSLDESERSMLDYVLGIETYREEVTRDVACDVLLVETTGPVKINVAKDMGLVWSGTRPGDLRERFYLYVKKDKRNPDWRLASK